MERRKFLQMLVVGVVALAAKITGGLGAGPEQPEAEGGYVVPEEYEEILMGGMRGGKSHLAGQPCLVQFTQTPENPDSWVHLEGADEFTLSKSIHSNWYNDTELWKFKRRQTKWEGPLPPGFVILEPSETMKSELAALKAAEISILARYTDAD